MYDLIEYTILRWKRLKKEKERVIFRRVVKLHKRVSFCDCASEESMITITYLYIASLSDLRYPILQELKHVDAQYIIS